MPPSSYLTRASEDDGFNAKDPNQVFRHMFKFYLTKKSGSGGVIRSNFMQGYEVLFDIDNNRVGFTKSDCQYSALVDDEHSGLVAPGPSLWHIVPF
jgi:hypothetical protein